MYVRGLWFVEKWSQKIRLCGCKTSWNLCLSFSAPASSTDLLRPLVCCVCSVSFQSWGKGQPAHFHYRKWKWAWMMQSEVLFLLLVQSNTKPPKTRFLNLLGAEKDPALLFSSHQRLQAGLSVHFLVHRACWGGARFCRSVVTSSSSFQRCILDAVLTAVFCSVPADGMTASCWHWKAVMRFSILSPCSFVYKWAERSICVFSVFSWPSPSKENDLCLEHEPPAFLC